MTQIIICFPFFLSGPRVIFSLRMPQSRVITVLPPVILCCGVRFDREKPGEKRLIAAFPSRDSWKQWSPFGRGQLHFTHLS